jgi:hypothetical protein
MVFVVAISMLVGVSVGTSCCFRIRNDAATVAVVAGKMVVLAVVRLGSRFDAATALLLVVVYRSVGTSSREYVSDVVVGWWWSYNCGSYMGVSSWNNMAGGEGMVGNNGPIGASRSGGWDRLQLEWIDRLLSQNWLFGRAPQWMSTFAVVVLVADIGVR